MSALPSARVLTARARRRLGLSSDPRRPSRTLFGGIRRKLTLWYGCTLAAALILSGIVLYVVVQQSLLGPMNSTLSRNANLVTYVWQRPWLEQGGFGPTEACPEFTPPTADANLLISCFDTHGTLLGFNDLVGGNREALKSFLNPSLARAAAGSSGSVGDTISTGDQDEFASVQRYAVKVPNLNGQGTLGVLVVGLPVGGQGAALSTLLHLLLLLGGLTLLASLGAGVFLANRALQPARIAYARQRDFIADASHELRTPLTMLRSSVEFVLRGSTHLAPDDVSLLEDTVQETTHLTLLANTMLDMARLDSDEVHIEEDVVDIAQVAAEVSRWAQPLAAEMNVSLTSDSGDGQPALVLGDRSLLEQAVLVLVDNAIKYNRAGGSVSVSVSRAGDEVVVRVADTGIGVEAEHLSRLGERFYRVDKARSRESGGAGLGLSIVRSVIDRHNGRFEITSEPGKGTTATVHLPLIG